MVTEGKYWSALRVRSSPCVAILHSNTYIFNQCLDDIPSIAPTLLLQTPFYQHLLSSLPSLRGQIKDAVTASMKQWLLEIRNNSGDVGRLALDNMETRVAKMEITARERPLLEDESRR